MTVVVSGTGRAGRRAELADVTAAGEPAVGHERGVGSQPKPGAPRQPVARDPVNGEVHDTVVVHVDVRDGPRGPVAIEAVAGDQRRGGERRTVVDRPPGAVLGEEVDAGLGGIHGPTLSRIRIILIYSWGMSAPTPDTADVCIVGAGPQGLAVALHLVQAGAPAPVVVDPSGRWMAAWDRQFAAYEIPHLRSPGVHHPGGQAGDWGTYRAGRNVAGIGRYDFPQTGCFADFCRELVAAAGIADAVRADRATEVVADGPDAAEVRLASGARIGARRVVVATNPRRPRIPPALAGLVDPVGPVRHSSSVDLARADVDRRTVVVAGGGLTAFHLVAGAVVRGAVVHLLARRPLRVSDFDASPGWLGPKYLHDFWAVFDAAARRAIALAARDGGSVTPAAFARIRELTAQGRLRVWEQVEIASAASGPAGVDLDLARGGVPAGTLRADEVWLATGGEPSIDSDPVLRALEREWRAPICDGLPVLRPDLRWADTPVHVAGALAMIELGPAAGNLWGARQAAVRIASSVLGRDVDEHGSLVVPPAAVRSG